MTSVYLACHMRVSDTVTRWSARETW